MNPFSEMIAKRGDQMFPRLSETEMARLARFGEPRSFKAGAAVGQVGESGRGLLVVKSGEIEVSETDAAGRRSPIVTHGPGNFQGELAQLSGRPMLVDVTALSNAEVIAIAPERVRALLVAEAELGEKIMRALILRRVGLIQAGAGPVIVGSDHDADVLRLTNFLRRNGHPFHQLDPETDAGAMTLIDRFKVEPEELPIVLCPGGQLLRNPGNDQLARCVGLVGAIDSNRVYDIVVAGAGPAGLATSVYAASEGLSVLTIDCRSFGGQAGASARIENYLGFPTGISGMALMGRAFSQAQKFGVEIAIPDEAIKLECGTDPCRLLLKTGERIQARSVVIATGARYRRLGVDRLEQFEGASIHYWASPLEAELCADQEVALVGGGNSAGQATVFLAGRARRVTLIARRPLEQTMSQYLIERIEAQPNIEVVLRCEVTSLEGEGGELSAVGWRNRKSGAKGRRDVRYLFSFIGAEPNTDWLAPSGFKLDERGFVLTGDDLGEGKLPMETSRSGVFAVGDVRACSVKRIAAAVGDGAQVVAAIHKYLAAREANIVQAGVPIAAQ